jgi:hypothetical protein
MIPVARTRPSFKEPTSRRQSSQFSAMRAAAENRIPFGPVQFLAGCITNTSSRPLVRDAVFLRITGHEVAKGIRFLPPREVQRIEARDGLRIPLYGVARGSVPTAVTGIFRSRTADTLTIG